MQGAPSLGRLLVSSGLVTQDALDEVTSAQKSDGRRLVEHLVEKGLVHPQQLAQLLAQQLACPWVSLERVEVSLEALNVLPREVALKHKIAPVHLRATKGQTALYVAMEDPTDTAALAAAAAAATMPVRPMIALATDIRAFLERIYGEGQAAPSTNGEGLTPTVPPVAPVRPTKPPAPKPPTAQPTTSEPPPS